MSSQDGVVHLWNLPEDKIFIKLKDNLQKIMIMRALEISKTQKELSRILSIGKATISDFKNLRFQSIRLSFVKRLSEFLVKNGLKEFSLENLEKRIELIRSTKGGKTIFNPRFPINFNCIEGSQIISAIFFDGGITSTSLLPFYFNNEKILVERIVENVKGVVGNVYFKKGKDCKNTYKVFFSQILGIILVSGLGIPPGQKVFTNPLVPEFILKGSKEIRKAFLQQAFDDEGSVKKSGCKAIQLSQYFIKKEPPIRLLQLKEMLENFGIRVNGPYFSGKLNTKKGYKSYGWSIQITNQRDILAFKEKTNFSLDRKTKKLDDVLSSYVTPPRFRRYTASEEFIRICRKLKDENMKITCNNIAKRVQRKERYVRKLLSKMIKENKLKVVKGQQWNGKGSLPKEFEIV